MSINKGPIKAALGALEDRDRGVGFYRLRQPFWGGTPEKGQKRPFLRGPTGGVQNLDGGGVSIPVPPITFWVQKTLKKSLIRVFLGAPAIKPSFFAYPLAPMPAPGDHNGPNC